MGWRVKMKKLIILFFFLISILGVNGTIILDEVKIIENNNNYNIKLQTDKYLVYSTLNSDLEKDVDYFLYKFDANEKISLGKFKGSSPVLYSKDSFYIIQTTSSGFTSYNLKEYRVMVGYYNSSSNKINFIFDKKLSNFISFNYDYQKSKDGDFLLSFTEFQDINFNNITKVYDLDLESDGHYKLSESKVTELTKSDYYNLKESNFFFENSKYQIRDNFILDKKTMSFTQLKRSIFYEDFCGIKENTIYLKSKKYEQNNPNPISILISYDYLLNKQINSTELEGNCLYSSNFNLFNEKLNNLETNETTSLKINGEILGLSDNSVLFKNSSGIFSINFNRVTYNDEEITQFVNKSLNLYNYNNLNELMINVNNLYKYYSESIINDYKTDFQNINSAENTYLTLNSNCKSKTLNKDQINLCDNISTKITIDYNSFNSKINYEITEIKLITENLIEVKVNLNLTGINNLNENVILKIKKSNNGYLITNVENDKLYFNTNKSTEYLNLLIQQNQLFNNLKSTSSNSQKTTYTPNNNSSSDSDSGFNFLVIITIVIIIYLIKIANDHANKAYLVICPHCNKENEYFINKIKVKEINNGNQYEIKCLYCSKKIRISSIKNKSNFEEEYKNEFTPELEKTVKSNFHKVNTKMDNNSKDSYLLERLNYLYSYKNYANPNTSFPGSPEEYRYNSCCWLCLIQKPLLTYKYSGVKICEECTNFINMAESETQLVEFFHKTKEFIFTSTKQYNGKFENELENKKKVKLDQEKIREQKENLKKKQEEEKIVEQREKERIEKLRQVQEKLKLYNKYKMELENFHKEQKTFILKNYIVFFHEKFGDNSEIKYLSKYLDEELSKNISVSLIENQLKEILKERKNIIKKYTMAEIDGMSGKRFEELLKELLDKLGYTNIKITKQSRDGGTDLIAFFNDKKVIIQAKRYQESKSLGTEALQEIISCKEEHKADRLMVITTAGKYSVDAKTKAHINNVELWARVEFKRKLMEVDLL